MAIQSHRDLIVWQRGMELAVVVYTIAKTLPASERFALATQMRRAASSIPANIAEGAGRVHRGDYLRFISIARGSAFELVTHLELAVRLSYVTESEVSQAFAILEETGKMLSKLSRVLAEKRREKARS